jgi:hypothetical protein
MISALKTYDKSFAEGMLARTSFYLDNDPVLKTLKPIENEGTIRDSIIAEICKNLNIPSATNNKQAVLDYLDNEIEKSTKLNKKTEKEILTRLSARGELPTDLYTVKIKNDIVSKEFPELFENENRITETVKNPDMAYNFGTNYSASIFAKFYKGKYEYNNFFLLVVGERKGLTFIVSQVWCLYNDIVSENSFTDALELLKYFVEKFGVEANFHERTEKFFIDVVAKNKNEFQIRFNKDKLKSSKKKESEFLVCHFLGPIPEDNNNLSIFYAIDIEKYKNYISKHPRRKLSPSRCIPKK